MTTIAFVGSVFSPYYAWARRRGPAEPSNHCALNVALYSPRAARWSMTERSAGQVERSASRFDLGRSSLGWDGTSLDIAVDEVCAPIPRRLRGSIRLQPLGLCERAFPLDTARRHLWRPLAPCARIEVNMSEPDLRWSGVAYLDSNGGSEPLEKAFADWTWSRAELPGESAVLYDVMPLAEPADMRSLALRFTASGTVEEFEPPPRCRLPPTGWRLARTTRADAGTPARVLRTLEDAPFYSRSLLDSRVLGRSAPAIHEALDLRRFTRPWVQAMLPFRMPRALR